MIYLITGVPGSGKTLYAVSTLVQKLLKDTIKGKDGKEIARRLVVDGIPDLVIPHDQMAPRPDDPVTIKGAPVQMQESTETGDGLHNWWTWCKPGDVLVVDEVQRYWRPRGMGTKPPQEIAMLETHRHFGVDFVVISQNAMLIDQNVRRLVGRHLNVRRVFGGARAIIYDWDGCQTDVHRTAGAVRSVWNYPKKAFDLYKSSELHTKQHQKIPLWFAFPLVVLALGIFAGPKAYSALSGVMTGKGIPGQQIAQSAPLPPPPGQLPQAAKPAASAPPLPPAATASAPSPAASAAPKLAGCATMRGQCRCYDQDAAPFAAPPELCETKTIAKPPLVVVTGTELAHLETSRPVTLSEFDVDNLARLRHRADLPRDQYTGTAARVAEAVAYR